MNGRSQLFRGPWFLGGATDRCSSAWSWAAAAENSLPATRIDPFPDSCCPPSSPSGAPTPTEAIGNALVAKANAIDGHDFLHALVERSARNPGSQQPAFVTVGPFLVPGDGAERASSTEHCFAGRRRAV